MFRLLKYLPEERKVHIDKDIYMSKKMQQQLNDISNAIRDNASPWHPMSLSIEYHPSNSSSTSSLNSFDEYSSSSLILYSHARSRRAPNICDNGPKFFCFDIYKDGPTTLTLRNYSHDDISIFEEVARKCSISELNIYSKLKTTPDLFKVLDALSSQLEVVAVNGDITPQWCSLLSKWISNAHCPKMTSLKLQNIGVEYNSDTTRAIYNGFDEVLSACKGKKDSLISFSASSGGILEYNRFRRLSELDEYNISRKKLVVESLANMIKECCIVGKEQYFKFEEFAQAVEQMIEYDILRLTWNLKNNHKIHTELIEKLMYTGACNAIDIRKTAKTCLSEICTAIFNKYILPNITGIDIEFFKKLALELQERIVGFTTSKVFNSSSNTEEAHKIKNQQSTVNEVEDSLLKLQEQTTESRAEAAIYDNVPAYDAVDNNNNIYQLPEDLLASDNQNFTFQYNGNFLS